jgi:hypothetical protein
VFLEGCLFDLFSTFLFEFVGHILVVFVLLFAEALDLFYEHPVLGFEELLLYNGIG